HNMPMINTTGKLASSASSQSPRWGMVYELDTLPHKENTSWWCSARCFSAEILIPSHLATSEQCQLAGTPVWDDAASFGAFLTTAWPEPRAVQSTRGDLGSGAAVNLSPAVITWPFRKTCTTRTSGGLVS